MRVASLSLNNLRSYDGLYTVEFHPDTTLIIGKNGTGKTSLLEALYLLHRGTSFRGRDRDIIPYDHTRSEMKIEFSDASHTRRATLHITPDEKIQKQFIINNEKKTARLTAKERLPVVLFEPDELRLLTSSPARRRDFIDGIIGRLSPTYATVISRFQRTLLQRNELLKQFESMKRDTWESHLFAWDVKFAELGASIIKARINFLLHSHDRLSQIYSSIASESHRISTAYVSDFPEITDNLQQRIIHQLEARHQSDGLRGYTSVGPHRDDIELFLDGHPANEVASRGEMRTIMLAFKLLEVELQEHHSGQKPLILLDDVFSELDTEREKQLIEALSGYQTIITATDMRNQFGATAVIEL